MFAGSMEFVAVDLLTAAFDPLGAFAMAVMVNARHLFYGLAMLTKYKGKFKPYLIFGLCDESFSINCTAEPPDDVDSEKFYFWVTLLNQAYWVTGAAMGLLVVYCFKSVSIMAAPHGLPELISTVVIVALHLWKRNMLLSIAGGTACYIALVNFVF